jgi:hypothetical protein
MHRPRACLNSISHRPYRCLFVSSLKVRGRVNGGFAGLWRSAGVRDWRLLFPGSCDVHGERLGGSRDRAEPGRCGGAGGVLEVASWEPDDRAAGNGSRGACGGMRLFYVRPIAGSSGAGSAAGCSHPFGCPGRGRAHGAGPRQKRRPGGVNQVGDRAALGVGRWGRHKGGLAPGRWPGGAVHAARAGTWAMGDEFAGGPGQAADLPVAQAVEDQGEQPAGGGDLGDVAGLLAAASLTEPITESRGTRWMASISASAAAAIPA